MTQFCQYRCRYCWSDYGRNVDATKLNDWNVYLPSAQDKIAFTLLNYHLSSLKCSEKCHSMQGSGSISVYSSMKKTC